ncbi:hypothetical protein [Rhodopirellula sp. SWK7]|uniref:hypothetical protein n=1 Tax=Rhodopirellula sp. SWK7 TaxID=595460 RepID=UPI0002BDC3FA|nr:hypothetical protein [Rhodopirellula sp. SWK7]EMI44912.1 hypothetical protein RRSWK_02552 [Rhodopirellula sp. SWK7]
MTRIDLDPAVEQIEEAVDSACLSNPLLKCNRDLAIWTYLAFCEDMLFKELTQNPSGPRRSAMFADRLVNTMKYPVRWIWQHCVPNGHLGRQHDEQRYSAAWDLSKLADRYEPFETVYIFARAGCLQLSANGAELIHTGWTENMQCEAYDHLVDEGALGDQADPKSLFDCVSTTVRVKYDRFSYPLTPGVVEFARETMSPVTTTVTRLPRTWQFPGFTMGQFHDVTSCIRAIAMVHQMARSAAACKGCEGLGIRDSVLIESRDDLIARLCRYASLERDTVSSILDVLTYGSSGQQNSDPALQPLLPLSDGKLAIAPALWISLDVERNYCVLANRIPAAKNAYSTFSEDRSRILEQTIREELGSMPVRFWSGSVPGRPDLPDFDLVVIDETSRTCLVLELKSFIQPAEPREIIDRSREIRKGVSQIEKLRAYAKSKCKELSQLLNIESGYRFSFAVASQNSIGSGNVQDKSTPVVRASHLIDSLRGRGVASTCDWLEARAYMPVEGKHFDTVPTQNEVAGRILNWYGIRPLVESLSIEGSPTKTH